MVGIIHEGKTDREFFTALLEAYSLPNTQNDIKYYNFEGVDNIFKISHKYYDEIEKDNILSSILIVIDADEKYDEYDAKLNKLIEDLSFDSIEVDYYIMCDDDKTGNLESFLLSILDDEQKLCIKQFRECYKYDLSDKWAYKTFYKHKKHPFDFNHPNFNELKQKLQTLFEGINR
jgi:hypothetical protein